jgi:hypothetical protein
MGEKKVITINYVTEYKVYELDWELLSGKQIVGTSFWDDTMVFYSDTLTRDQLIEYRDFLDDVIDADVANGKDAWDEACDDKEGYTKYIFDTEQVTIILVQ